jgi:predicted ATPase/DNA-binding winged helix-turn-helix (wHTH) protein
MALSETPLMFGPFRLFPAQRRLEKDGIAVRLGGRALDILIALAERAGQTVSSQWLVERVWAEAQVTDGTLRFHINNLRRALGEGVDGARYIVNVPGRGYRFVAPLRRLDDSSAAGLSDALPAARVGLPRPRRSILGRADSISAVSRDLVEERLVTITGPAGIGKTTLAIATVHSLRPELLRFVDLAPVEDGGLVATTVASVLGVVFQARDPVPEILELLRNKPLLIVFDNCEQVIHAVAGLAHHILRGTADARVLVTSREPLRLEGERIYRLTPLECPPPQEKISAREAIAYPAVQLFVDHTAASISGFILDDERAPLVAEICRRLDGIPLAIELAAARVEFFGVAGLARRLDNMFNFLTHGRRFALPRHQTLRATLDWGYNHLSRDEQSVLRRISIFRAAFSLDSAAAVAESVDVSRKSAIEAIASLVAKSLLNAGDLHGVTQYRLLQTTRYYASEKLSESGELRAIVRRHAEHHLEIIEDAYYKWKFDFAKEWIQLHAGSIDDIRAALEWSFAQEGDTRLGIALTALSAPLWFALSLIYEYRDRAEYAHTRLASDPRPTSEIERMLNLSLSTALFYTRGAAPEVPKAAPSMAAGQLRAIWQLAGVRLVHGDYRGAVLLSDEFDRICTGTGNDAAAAAGDRMRAFALHLSGRHAEAEVRARRALGRQPTLSRESASFNESEIDNQVASLTHLARILWVRGYAVQAVAAAEEGLARALSLRDPAAACFILAYTACPIAFWTGDSAALSRYTAAFDQQQVDSPQQFWVAWRQAYQAIAAASVEGIDTSRAARYRSLLTKPPDDVMLVDMLATIHEELVGPDVVTRADRGECGWCLPEVNRALGVKLLEEHASPQSQSEMLFVLAMEIAREQGALAWELRAATSLARLKQGEGDRRGAYAALAPVYARFTEGFATGDLAAATRLLAELGAEPISARRHRTR